MNTDLEIKDLERKCRNLNYGWMISYTVGAIFLGASIVMPIMLGAGVFFFGSSIMFLTVLGKQQNAIGILKILKEVNLMGKGRKQG